MSKAGALAGFKTSVVGRYGLAVVSVATATAVTYLLQPYIFRTPLFFLAIMFSTWVGGRGPGLLAVLLSTLSLSLALNPQGVLETHFPNVPNVVAFLLMSMVLGAWSTERGHVKRDLQRARDELETKVQERTTDLSRSNEQLQREIAERKRAEEAVHRSEDRIRLIIDTIPVMAWTVRPDGVVDFLNRRWTEYAGLSLEQYVADPAGSIHPQDAPRVFEKWQERMAHGETYEDEMRLRRADGEYRWFLVRTAPLRDEQGNIVKWYGVSTDIEDRKRAGEALRESQRKLEEAQRIAHVGHWERDLDTGLTKWSDELYRIFGLSPQEGSMPLAKWEQMLHPEDRERVLLINEESHRNVRRYDVEYHIVRPNGEVRYIHSRGDLLRDEEGRPRRTFGVAQDITERKRAEEALEESRRKLEEAERIANIGYWESDLLTDPITITLSEETCRLFGLGTRRVLSQAEVREMIHPDDREIERLMFEEVLKGRRQYDAEYRFVRPDGEVRFIHAWDEVSYDGDGRPARMFGTVQDITERKQAEDALRESEERFRAMADTAPVMIWMSGADRLCTFFNKGWLDFTGRTLAEELGDGWAEGVHPDDYQRCLSTYINAFEARRNFEMEYRLRRADGEYRWLLDTGVPRFLSDGSFAGYIGSCLDITERKLAEEQLRRSEEQARGMLDAIPQQIWSGPSDGSLDYCNQQWRAYAGLGLEEIQGDGWQAMLHPDDKDRVLAAWRESVETGGPYEQEERHRRQDGAYRWFLCRGVPLKDSEGRIERWYGANTDIEDRVRAEERLKRSYKELRALSARLQSVREEEGTRIAREIHDELGGALTGLKWDLEEIEEIISAATDAPQLTAMREKLEGMVTLADNTMDAVRRIASELRPTALEEFGLAEALRWHAQQFEARTGIIVHCDCPPESESLSREQAAAVFRIVQEALTNVLRHAQATKVEIKIRREEGRYVLTVSDDGRGISEAEKNGPQSLGLLGMRERAHLLGGDINIEGAEGQGTVVTLRVPLSG